MADVTRRDFVKAAVVAGAAGAIGAGALSSVLPILDGTPGGWGPAPIVRRQDGKPRPVRVADLGGEPVVAHVAEWMHAPAVVYKVRKSTLAASSALRGYNTGQHAIQHPAEAESAILAYDGRCTHLGCTVGYNKELGASKDVPAYEADALPGRVLCPCHFAQFDVFDLGRHMPGTPAPRPLDAIPVRLGPEVDGSPTLEGLRRIRQDGYRDADLQGPGSRFRLAG